MPETGADVGSRNLASEDQLVELRAENARLRAENEQYLEQIATLRGSALHGELQRVMAAHNADLERIGHLLRLPVEGTLQHHTKRGTDYVVLTRRARAQASTRPIGDMDDVTVYMDVTDGHVSIRRTAEFEDGRFVEKPA